MELRRLDDGDLAPALTPIARPRLVPSPFAAAAILLLVAIAARACAFGNPIIHIDEQFYRLVGGRMLEGALPYVDIFDRKPIGLFLIYAAARWPGGDGIVAYQLLALACAWGTACLLFMMARRIAPPMGALAAGAIYLLALDLAGGEGGQAPVFYNLPMTAAAAILLHRIGERSGGPLRLPGAGAMLLVGVALQIKYSAVFEGIFFGLVLIVRSVQLGRARPALVLDTMLWIGCALAPTLLAMLAYAAGGHLDQWLFANVTSILRRGHEAPATIGGRVRLLARLTLPLLAVLPLRYLTGPRPSDDASRAMTRFADGWTAAALLGVILFGTWYDHYALPLFAPLALIAAPLVRARFGQAYLSLLLVGALVIGQHMMLHRRQSRGDGATLRGMIEAAGRFRGCAFVYDGMPAFYDATGSCLPTTRPFPSHLQARNEIGATGIDETAEVRRIMAARPERVMSMEPAYREENPAPRAALYQSLRADYVELRRDRAGSRAYVLYALRGTIRDRPAVAR